MTGRMTERLRRWRPTALVATLLATAVLAGSACSLQDDAAPDGNVPAPRATSGIWLSDRELAALPTSGAAWERVQEAASGDLGQANLADQDSDHDVQTLAAALVAARTGDRAMQDKAVSAISSAMGTEDGGRTLAIGRNLQSYVIAADLVDLDSADPQVGARFRTWLRAVRTEDLDGDTLVETSNQRPNNWGTHATASLIAAAAYLEDTAELDRLANVFRGWTGERDAYSGFNFGSDLSWQFDDQAPVGINRAGATIDGVDVGGALPEEMRRGGSFTTGTPGSTGYPWGALNGAVVSAELLSRRGFDAWSWGDTALKRATDYLYKLGWEPGNDDEWVVPLVNARNDGKDHPVPSEVGLGKNLGFTDWTHGPRSPG
jgi:hypothetical protein